MLHINSDILASLHHYSASAGPPQSALGRQHLLTQGPDNRLPFTGSETPYIQNGTNHWDETGYADTQQLAAYLTPIQVSVPGASFDSWSRSPACSTANSAVVARQQTGGHPTKMLVRTLLMPQQREHSSEM